MSNPAIAPPTTLPASDAAIPNPMPAASKIERIARVTHETNRAYCSTLGDDSQKPWDEAEQWQRDSALKGVQYALDNPGVTPAQMHESWMTEKLEGGWKFGPVKEAAKKEHPCMVPYYKLAPEQQLKDALFRAIVFAFRDQAAPSLV